MFSALLSQAALTFGKGQHIFVMSLGNHCCVTAVFPIEMVSDPGSFRKDDASKEALSPLISLCPDNRINGTVSCLMLQLWASPLECNFGFDNSENMILHFSVTRVLFPKTFMSDPNRDDCSCPFKLLTVYLTTMS